MDYELLHEISLIDREILRIKRTMVNKDTERELNGLKNQHKNLKINYEMHLKKQNELLKKIKSLSKELDEKTKEKEETEYNLYSTSNLKTIETYQNIIERLNGEIKEFEDEVYQLMGENDIITDKNKKQVVDVNEIRSNYNDILGKYKEKQKELENIIDELSNKRSDLISNVSLEARKLYEELRMEHGFGMSEVKGEICTGCNVGIPIVIIDEVRNTKKLIKCPNCNRLLYTLE